MTNTTPLVKNLSSFSYEDSQYQCEFTRSREININNIIFNVKNHKVLNEGHCRNV